MKGEGEVMDGEWGGGIEGCWWDRWDGWGGRGGRELCWDGEGGGGGVERRGLTFWFRDLGRWRGRGVRASRGTVGGRKIY